MFIEWTESEKKEIEREIQRLKDYLKKSMTQYGINQEELNRFDLAQYNSGGRVVSVHNTKLMEDCSLITLFMGLCNRKNPPEKALQNDLSPGQCFCFQGQHGEFTIRLICEAMLNYVTIEHIPPSMSPINDISSAPKSFSLIGLNGVEDNEGFDFGSFEFDPKISNTKSFELPNKSKDKFRWDM